MHAFQAKSHSREDMGAAERSVRTYLKELEKAELLEIKQRGLGKTNLYRLYLTVKPAQGSPALTGKFCRSGAATIAGLERQIWPLSLYKNTHLRILILIILSRGMHFSIKETHSNHLKATHQRDARNTHGYNRGTPDLYPQSNQKVLFTSLQFAPALSGEPPDPAPPLCL